MQFYNDNSTMRIDQPACTAVAVLSKSHPLPGHPPVEEPPNEPKKPPVEEPGEPFEKPPIPEIPPVEIPEEFPPEPPVKEPPHEDPSQNPTLPPIR